MASPAAGSFLGGCLFTTGHFDLLSYLAEQTSEHIGSVCFIPIGTVNLARVQKRKKKNSSNCTV